MVDVPTALVVTILVVVVVVVVVVLFTGMDEGGLPASGGPAVPQTGEGRCGAAPSSAALSEQNRKEGLGEAGRGARYEIYATTRKWPLPLVRADHAGPPP